MPSVAADPLRGFADRLLQGMRAPPEAAAVVAAHLVDANLAGHDSHGVIRLPQYWEQVQACKVLPDRSPQIVRESPTTAVVAGGWAWGPLTADFAMKTALAKAKSHGLAAVSARECGHVGRVGVYPAMAAEQGFIARVWCNTHGVARVAAWGGREARLGTNPIAMAVPTRGRPIVVDVTTSVVAEGKVRLAKNRGDAVPPEWVLDREGRSTTNPADLYDGGTLQPLGGSVVGHKGVALSMMVDVFGGILSGAGCGQMPGVGYGNGLLIEVVDPAAFEDREEFLDRVDAYVAYLRSGPKREGFTEILMPGEPEDRIAAKRRETGIPLDDATLLQLRRLASSLGVAGLDAS